jgi:hypothetical protein
MHFWRIFHTLDWGRFSILLAQHLDSLGLDSKHAKNYHLLLTFKLSPWFIFLQFLLFWVITRRLVYKNQRFGTTVCPFIMVVTEFSSSVCQDYIGKSTLTDGWSEIFLLQMQPVSTNFSCHFLITCVIGIFFFELSFEFLLNSYHRFHQMKLQLTLPSESPYYICAIF